jgi:hypothetical protein
MAVQCGTLNSGHRRCRIANNFGDDRRDGSRHADRTRDYSAAGVATHVGRRGQCRTNKPSNTATALTKSYPNVISKSIVLRYFTNANRTHLPDVQYRSQRQERSDAIILLTTWDMRTPGEYNAVTLWENQCLLEIKSNPHETDAKATRAKCDSTRCSG